MCDRCVTLTSEYRDLRVFLPVRTDHVPSHPVAACPQLAGLQRISYHQQQQAELL